MNSKNQYHVSVELAKNAHINSEQYHALYHQSIHEPAKFWDEQAKKFITWFKPWQTVTRGDFNSVNVEWFINGKLNACYNCVDRHLATRKNQTALIWEGNSLGETKHLTYQQLHEQICQFANVLLELGIKKGDRVCIYLPMIPEAVITMLACARIGAIHSVVFAGFSADALKNRILDADCRLLITADEGLRGDKTIPLKHSCDTALEDCPGIKHLIVVKRTGNPIHWHSSRDLWYHEAMQHAAKECPVEPMDSADPLFILYTSGSTGKPKGVLHNTGGYLVYVAMTHRYVFDYHDLDVHWCSADIGWITGHSYLVYGPLSNGATTLLFEGIPNYPTFSRYWEIIDKHQVTIFYTAPTAIRAIRREGDEWVKRTNRQSLKLLGTVGEPINPDAWEWYYNVVGEKRCPIVNTWWQTETGGILLTQFPGATPLVAGSVGWPFFGIVPVIVNKDGKPIQENQQGNLLIQKPWPGLMQTIYGDKQRFIDTYFKRFPGNFLTGDGAYRATSGDYWITGRTDDVLNISGHRIGTEEVESALVSHPAVTEAAVVGIPNDIKGEGIYAFVTTQVGIIPTEALKKELVQQVRDKIGPVATLEKIQWANALPKTRSGKIMRRILRKIASNELDDLGDTSTLADELVIEQLIRERN
ncbi:MAG: acetate--CoA ligase [Legionellales bacterium RIFCSPHIGHO2_12_FULL_42_9]|nr:MAG: acetate--CoA ligase [Legionellales bacterium RIFCSPHIGHO2_12_FULL_42_9]